MRKKSSHNKNINIMKDHKIHLYISKNNSFKTYFETNNKTLRTVISILIYSQMSLLVYGPLCYDFLILLKFKFNSLIQNST